MQNDNQFNAVKDLAINDGALLYNRKDADRTQLLGLLELAWE